MFPIKYIDNNLVWNKDNEVFAYYELIPYNYSFLSAEQKFIVHDSFRQLIAQSREGKIHALQIATESSIRSMQEQSKKDKANAVKENIKDMPTQTAYAVYSAKEKAKSSVSDFKRGMVQEEQSRQSGRLEKQEQRKKNIADKRMELQKAQEARQAQRKADGSATTGATRPHERPATASTIPKSSAEKMQEVKRPATAPTPKASEPVKTNVVKERPLSSGASDKKTTQPAQPVHRQNVEKVVSQETRQNYTKDRRTKVQQTQTVQKNQQTTEKTPNLVMKKGQKKK